MQPFWQATLMEGEALFFIQREAGRPATARLLFPPEEFLGLKSATGETAYELDRDFVLDPASGTLQLTPASKIPFKGPAEMYPPEDSNLPKYPHRRGDPHTFLIFGEGPYFHRLQAEATYRHQAGLWQSYIPAFAGALLPKTQALLRERRALKLSIAGDSISVGGDVSGLTGAPPFQPSYVELVKRGLERAYGAQITLANFAKGGWISAQGLADAGRLAESLPDLVFVAFGMNDSREHDATGFVENVRKIMERVLERSPEAEFVLVAPMLCNPEWHKRRMEIFPAMRDALAELAARYRPRAVLADLTAVWTELLRRKSYHDLSGNGINHPNDFGHRVYAQVVLALLVPEPPDVP